MTAPNDYSHRVRLRCRRKGCLSLRRTSRKRPEQYVTERMRLKYCGCPRCGRVMIVDQYRQSKRERRHVRCNCGARPWKHTRGAACKVFAASQPVDPQPGLMTQDEWLELAP